MRFSIAASGNITLGWESLDGCTLLKLESLTCIIGKRLIGEFQRGGRV